MWAAILLAAAQATSADVAKQELDLLLARTELISNQAFDCMEAETKDQLKNQIEDGSPETIVDGALAKCAHLKVAYVKAATSTYISSSKAQEIADGSFDRIRVAYLKVAQKWMSDPVVTELRSKFVISHWRDCVTGKAHDWSRLRDEANTVGSAAVTACANFEPRVRVALASELRSKQLPETEVNKVVDGARETMRAVAVEAVISERAKRLPKQ